MIDKSQRWMVLMLAAAPLVAAGCQRFDPTTGYNPQVAHVEMEPDPAMQQRIWDRSTAEYVNGDVIAGPTWQTFQPSENLGAATYTAVQVPVFLGNVALMPVQMVIRPPGSEVVYQGEQFEPTYTGMPVSTLSGQIIHEQVEQDPYEEQEQHEPEPAAPDEM